MVFRRKPQSHLSIYACFENQLKIIWLGCLLAPLHQRKSQYKNMSQKRKVQASLSFFSSSKMRGIISLTSHKTKYSHICTYKCTDAHSRTAPLFTFNVMHAILLRALTLIIVYITSIILLYRVSKRRNGVQSYTHRSIIWLWQMQQHAPSHSQKYHITHISLIVSLILPSQKSQHERPSSIQYAHIYIDARLCVWVYACVCVCLCSATHIYVKIKRRMPKGDECICVVEQICFYLCKGWIWYAYRIIITDVRSLNDC